MPQSPRLLCAGRLHDEALGSSRRCSLCATSDGFAATVFCTNLPQDPRAYPLASRGGIGYTYNSQSEQLLRRMARVRAVRRSGTTGSASGRRHAKSVGRRMVILLALTIAVVAAGFSDGSQAVETVAAPASASVTVNHPSGEPCNPGLPHNGHGQVCATAGSGSFAIPTVFADAFLPTIPLLFAPWPSDHGSGVAPMPRYHPPQLRLIV